MIEALCGLAGPDPTPRRSRLPCFTHFTIPPTQRNTMLPPPLRFVVPAELAIFGQHADADADADAAALGARA